MIYSYRSRQISELRGDIWTFALSVRTIDAPHSTLFTFPVPDDPPEPESRMRAQQFHNPNVNDIFLLFLRSCDFTTLHARSSTFFSPRR